MGHDHPQYFIDIEWLENRKDVLWIHCKNREALEKMSSASVEFNYFYHECDRYTLTSKGIGWVLVGQIPFSKSIIVLPESINYYDKYEGTYDRIMSTMGICTDKCLFYKSELNESSICL